MHVVKTKENSSTAKANNGSLIPVPIAVPSLVCVSSQILCMYMVILYGFGGLQNPGKSIFLHLLKKFFN